MRGDGTFSEDWHGLYNRIANSFFDDRDLLREIEEQLSQYESIWNDCKPLDTQDLKRVQELQLSGEDTLSVNLRLATYNIDLLVRVGFVRSIHLVRSFIGAMNRNDFESVPFLLRALIEQAALLMHAAKRIRPAFVRFQSNGPAGERPFFETLHRLLVGARANYDGLTREFQKLQKQTADGGHLDFEISEFSIFKQLVERGEFGEKNTPRTATSARADSVAKWVDDLASENPIEGAPPTTLRDVWEYLSEYCHPGPFSGNFYLAEAIRDGEGSTSEEQDALLPWQRCVMLARFVESASWIVPLPLLALGQLVKLESEIAREADAIGLVR